MTTPVGEYLAKESTTTNSSTTTTATTTTSTSTSTSFVIDNNEGLGLKVKQLEEVQEQLRQTTLALHQKDASVKLLTGQRNHLLEENDHLIFKLNTIAASKNSDLQKIVHAFDERVNQIKRGYDENLQEVITQLKEALQAKSKMEQENIALREEMRILAGPLAANEHTESNVIEQLLKENLALKTANNDLRVQVHELKLQIERNEQKSKENTSSLEGNGSGNFASIFGKAMRKNSSRQLLQEEENFQKMANELRTNHELLATQNENLLSELVVMRRKLFESEEKRQQAVSTANQQIETYKALITDLKLSLDLLNSNEAAEDDSLDEALSGKAKNGVSDPSTLANIIRKYNNNGSHCVTTQSGDSSKSVNPLKFSAELPLAKALQSDPDGLTPLSARKVSTFTTTTTTTSSEADILTVTVRNSDNTPLLGSKLTAQQNPNPNTVGVAVSGEGLT